MTENNTLSEKSKSIFKSIAAIREELAHLRLQMNVITKEDYQKRIKNIGRFVDDIVAEIK